MANALEEPVKEAVAAPLASGHVPTVWALIPPRTMALPKNKIAVKI